MEDTKTVRRGSGKRERLVEGAQGAFHEQGVERTTLSDVASRADVPLGNVYYYFKTKDQLVEAALEAHADAMRETLRSAERHRTPRARLKAMVRAFGKQATSSPSVAARSARSVQSSISATTSSSAAHGQR